MFTYRHSLKTINKELLKVSHKAYAHDNGVYELCERSLYGNKLTRVCGVYLTKSDLVTDINKLIGPT